MKAITIQQPFATLIALGIKTIETRAWNTDYRGDLLIHAGKGKDYLYLCKLNPFKAVLAEYGYSEENLPMGAIVAKVNLKNVCKVMENKTNGAILNNCRKVEGFEFFFGDYGIGRYAWILDNVKSMELRNIRGYQRLWEYNSQDLNNLLKIL